MIARNVQLVPNWHGLCSLLDLTADDIDDIETRHPTSTTDRCYDSLVRWAQAAADDQSERSLPALIQLLRRGQYHEIAGDKTTNDVMNSLFMMSMVTTG